MEEITIYLKDYRIYLFAALALVVLWLAVKYVLNRPSREERAHRERFERLKDRHKERYRNIRPPK
jgi:hypothetical protein